MTWMWIVGGLALLGVNTAMLLIALIIAAAVGGMAAILLYKRSRSAITGNST